MKIKTEILKEMVSKSIKGSSQNKLLPITNYIGIEVKNKILTLITTDGNNQLKIKQEIELDPVYGPVNEQEFYTIVNADTFSKLVNKTTSETIELENKENYLEVKANNGIYKLEIPINEEGKMVEFPKQDNLEGVVENINIASLKNVLLNMKVTIAKTMEIPCLTGYYLSEKDISTDRQTMTYIDDKLTERELLITSEMGELLQLLEGEYVNLHYNSGKLLFETDNISIYGPELEGKDIYPVQSIENVINLSYDNTIKLNKQDLLNVLDRMELFITPYDKNGVYLDFSVSGIRISSQASTASEEIRTKYTNDNKEFNCLVDIQMLKSMT